MSAEKAPSVIALAGRRVDRRKSSLSRFPEARVPAVRLEIAKLLTQEHAVAIVSSAACGADLIGLEEAERLGIRRRIVLPFTRERFRTKSVSDCPGNWLSAFDRIIAMGSATQDLVVLDQSLADSQHAFAAANERIILEARQVASALLLSVLPRLIAVVVWEGQARQGSDTTAAFRTVAVEAGFELRTVLTV